MKKYSQHFLESFKFPIIMLAIMWGIHIIKVVTGARFAAMYGMYPRSTEGILGIFTSPLIHSNWQHLTNNSVPFLVLGVMIFLFYRRIALKSFVLIYILTGLAVWIFARDVIHIGASGVVYGLVSFVAFLGIFRRNIKSIVLSLIILFLYSGMFYGVLPNQPGISWESHLLGGIVGIIVAWIFRKQIELDEKPQYTQEETVKTHYFEKDIFE
jgi:membrane associated rhomboid family serine protease